MEDDEDEDDDDDEEEEEKIVPKGKNNTKKMKADDEDEGVDNPLKGAKKSIKDLEVPEGGYGEDEDCLNAEDEDYRTMLETLEKEGVKKSTR